jgi:PleD family two-component response regulator
MTAAHDPESCVSRLLIADDRARTRQALRAVLATHWGFELIGEAADGDQAMAEVERPLHCTSGRAALRSRTAVGAGPVRVAA